jgi:A/G-specific adenine glycosylase
MIQSLGGSLTEYLLGWYQCNRRELPWRKTGDPYRIWLSEIMLQQTQVETVIPYYHRFLEAFPTVQDLARASLDQVLLCWENLGYYARARHLHEAAKIIVARFGGNLPENREALLKLPGIGAYTAGAILSIAFGQTTPALDGNARRVLSRIFAVTDSIDEGPTQKYLENVAWSLIPSESTGCFNQALMELGALLCRAAMPHCPSCPLRDFCRACAGGLQAEIPVRTRRGPLPHRLITAGVLCDAERFLIVQRPPKGLLGALWKFPGDTMLAGETVDDCLRRTFREELGIGIETGAPIASIRHAYTHFRITLHAHHCRQEAGDPGVLKGGHWRWASLKDLRTLPFSKVDRMICQALLLTG